MSRQYQYGVFTDNNGTMAVVVPNAYFSCKKQVEGYRAGIGVKEDMSDTLIGKLANLVPETHKKYFEQALAQERKRERRGWVSFETVEGKFIPYKT